MLNSQVGIQSYSAVIDTHLSIFRYEAHTLARITVVNVTTYLVYFVFVFYGISLRHLLNWDNEWLYNLCMTQPLLQPQK